MVWLEKACCVKVMKEEAGDDHHFFEWSTLGQTCVSREKEVKLLFFELQHLQKY